MRNALPWLLAGALALTTIQATCASRGLDQAQEELDSLRTAELAARTEAAGWRTRLIETTEDLSGRLQDAEERNALHVSEKAELAREVETLGGRLSTVMDLYADARGQLVAQAVVHTDTAGAEPDSITAPLDDGLLSGRIAYFPTPREFDLDYRVQLALTAAVSEAPDGRGLVTLMPEDDRVSLSYGEVLFQPPEPVQHCSLGQQAKAVGVGALGIKAVEALINTLTP